MGKKKPEGACKCAGDGSRQAGGCEPRHTAEGSGGMGRAPCITHNLTLRAWGLLALPGKAVEDLVFNEKKNRFSRKKATFYA